MAELNRIAKRLHNISPEPVRLTLDDGTKAVFELSGTQFFQQEFQGEGTRRDDDAAYRFVTSEDNQSVLVGRKAPDDEQWAIVGEVVTVEAA